MLSEPKGEGERGAKRQADNAITSSKNRTRLCFLTRRPPLRNHLNNPNPKSNPFCDSLRSSEYPLPQDSDFLSHYHSNPHIPRDLPTIVSAIEWQGRSGIGSCRVYLDAGRAYVEELCLKEGKNMELVVLQKEGKR